MPKWVGTCIIGFMNHQGSVLELRILRFKDIGQNLAVQKFVEQVYPLLPTECLIVLFSVICYSFILPFCD